MSYGDALRPLVSSHSPPCAWALGTSLSSVGHGRTGGAEVTFPPRPPGQRRALLLGGSFRPSRRAVCTSQGRPSALFGTARSCTEQFAEHQKVNAMVPSGKIACDIDPDQDCRVFQEQSWFVCVTRSVVMYISLRAGFTYISRQ